MFLKSGFSVTVMGDLNIDITSELSALTYLELDHDSMAYETVRQEVGGTAANFALAAQECFYDIHVIGKVGADAFGKTIIGRLEDQGIHVHYSTSETSPTGLAICLRDANRSRYRGTRLLVLQRESANQILTVAEVMQHAPILTQSDLLVLDGYCMRHQPRRDACLHAMQVAHASEALIAFDVLPHDAYKLYDLETLSTFTLLADVILMEVNTAYGFLGFSTSEKVANVDAALTASRALRQLFPAKAFLLHFGIDNQNESLISLPNGFIDHRYTGYEHTNGVRGWGYKVAARELSEVAPIIKQHRTEP